MENDPYILGSQYYQKKKPRRAFSKDVYMLFISWEVRIGKKLYPRFWISTQDRGHGFFQYGRS